MLREADLFVLFLVGLGLEGALDHLNLLAAPPDILPQALLLVRVLVKDLAVRLLRQLAITSELAHTGLLGQFDGFLRDFGPLGVLYFELPCDLLGDALALDSGQVRPPMVKQGWIVGFLRFSIGLLDQLCAVEFLELAQGEVQLSQGREMTCGVARICQGHNLM